MFYLPALLTYEMIEYKNPQSGFQPLASPDLDPGMRLEFDLRLAKFFPVNMTFRFAIQQRLPSGCGY